LPSDKKVAQLHHKDDAKDPCDPVVYAKLRGVRSDVSAGRLFQKRVVSELVLRDMVQHLAIRRLFYRLGELLVERVLGNLHLLGPKRLFLDPFIHALVFGQVIASLSTWYFFMTVAP